MNQIAAKALSILKDVKSSVVSTVADNKPESRIIDLQIMDDEIYFITFNTKPFYRQLSENDNIAVTVINNNFTQVRLKGVAIEIGDGNLEKVFEHSPSLKELFPDGNKFGQISLFHLKNAKGEIFDISGDQAKLKRERFVLGDERSSQAGLFITEKCVSCGKCAEVCPFSAIAKRTPYRIEPTHCDECGYCYQVCPVGAIELPKGF